MDKPLDAEGIPVGSTKGKSDAIASPRCMCDTKYSRKWDEYADLCDCDDCSGKKPGDAEEERVGDVKEQGRGADSSFGDTRRTSIRRV
jgi:hypothetical protein